MRTGEGSYVDK